MIAAFVRDKGAIRIRIRGGARALVATRVALPTASVGIPLAQADPERAEQMKRKRDKGKRHKAPPEHASAGEHPLHHAEQYIITSCMMPKQTARS